MIVAGCDIGSTTAKAVLMEDNNILAKILFPIENGPRESAILLFEKIKEQTGIPPEKIDMVCGTGYGDKNIPYAKIMESEIVCHAKGALYLNSNIRTIIDIGGQDAKVSRIDEYGNIERYLYNDKCASGTGRFLEIVADVLDVSITELEKLHKNATKEIKLSNQCVVFVESEVISLLNNGEEAENIVKGMHMALASRVASMAFSIGVVSEIAFTGGVAQNKGMVYSLEKVLKTKLFVHEDCQVMGALGAAIIAKERAL